MKKVLFTLAALLVAFGNVSFAQHKADPKPSVTAQVFKHYGVSDESIIVPETAYAKAADNELVRVTYIYEEENDYYLLEEVTAVFANGEWTDMLKISYDYDFSGNVLEKLSKMNMGMNNWTNLERLSYSYEGGDLSEVIAQTWDGNDWENDIKEDYNYNGNVTTVLFWEWNGNTWTSDELYTYTYGTGTVELLIQYMQGGAWQNDEKETFTLDSDENILEILAEEWSDGNWENDEKTTYNYEGGVFTSTLVEEWNGASWESDYLYSYDYENGNATHGECKKMSGGAWVPANGSIEMAYGFGVDSKLFDACHTVDMTYVDITAVDESAQAANVLVYPVPAENELFIQAEGFMKAEVYSVTGQKLMESNVEKMNVSSLNQGVYLLKVYDVEGNCATQRVIVSSK